MGTGNHHKSVFPGVAGPMQPHPMTATATKPSVQKRGNTVTKKIRFHSVSCDDMAKQDAVFHRLDAADPEQGRKIAQRRKAIAKGKNTVGYDEYCRQIPRDKRRKRSMETPTTPDYTLDIPNKKWNGMVKAWRIALHKYDPQDLQESFLQASLAQEQQEPSKTGVEETGNVVMTVKEKELADAQSAGLLKFVRISHLSSPVTSSPTLLSQTDTSMEVHQLVDHVHNEQSSEMAELDQWEKARGDENDEDLYSEVDESDDDLL